MARHVVILRDDLVKHRAMGFVKAAPDGTVMELRDPKRSRDQNDKLWAMLGEISLQMQHHGRYLAPERWKALFLDALGQEVDVEPSLDGQRMVPVGNSSSRLTKSEFSALLEVIHAWGAEHGVQFHDGKEGQAEQAPPAAA